MAGLLALYGVTGADRKRLLEMAENLDARAWVEPHEDVLRLRSALMAFEGRARSLLNFSAGVVPGLLQTPAYARALHSVAGVTGEQQDEMVETRMDRQTVLTKVACPQYVAIIDEAVFRRGYGGAEVMVQQIDWLIGRAQQPNISIHVIPFRHGGYACPGPFSMLGFADMPPLVFWEHGGLSGFLDASADTDLFQDAAARLMRFALGSADSVNFMTRMAADYERG
ncbi:DUF5753 domain-containing protein [Alloactinosynnema sp. L-07]|uniref:DUF5753 domain-containing protein n=1 Tax=Alloactinosynnema sp. L-07 TaxID=1653480 RepID=UPI0012FAD857|nr:DUF5753 domain-containing protein [Alloactinosynnema sp. L-07]